MRKINKKFIIIFTILTVSLFALYNSSFLNGFISWGGSGPGEDKHLLYEYATDNMTTAEKNAYNKFDKQSNAPLKWIYNPNDPSNEAVLDYYVRPGRNENHFYQSKYLNSFYVYTTRLPDSEFTNQQYDHYILWSNHQSAFGEHATLTQYFTDKKWSYNLKNGWMEINDDNYHGSGAHMQVQFGKYVGDWKEWRYIGYTYMGSRIDNPYFPNDYRSSGPSYGVTYRVESWDPKLGLMNPSPYIPETGVNGNTEQLKQWFKDYLFKLPNGQGKHWIDEAYVHTPNNLDAAAKYWMDRLMWQIDPTKGSSVLVGWHNEGYGWFYRTIAIPSNSASPKPNIRLTKLTVKDAKTKQVIASATVSDDIDTLAKPVSLKPVLTPSGRAKLSKGRDYEISATYYNMNQNRETITRPTTIDYKVAYDDKLNLKGIGGDSDYDFISRNKIISTNYPDSIPANGYANFTWNYKVPDDATVTEQVKFLAQVSMEFFNKGDNFDTEDDTLKLNFDISSEDMSISEDNIVLLDSNGNSTTDVIQGRSYGVKVLVDKISGGTPVGEIGDTQNPFVTVGITPKLGAVNGFTASVVATQTLQPNSSVPISKNQFFVSNGGVLQVCVELDPKHTTLKQDSDSSNNKACKIFSSPVNLSVSNFTAKPTQIVVGDTEVIGSRPITFNFDIGVDSNQFPIKTNYVIKNKNGQILTSKTLDFFGVKNHISLMLTIPLNEGDNIYYVEVNLNPNTILETNRAGTNPYNDNIDTSTVNVYRNQTAKSVCNTPRTTNSWVKTYYIYEWSGYYHQETCSYSVCVEGHYQTVVDKYGYSTTTWVCTKTELRYYECGYCITTDTSGRNQSVNISETFSLSRVYFKSKVTTDNLGGWVDILNNPNIGKVKAGYGFDIKFYTLYDTTNYRNAPHPWRSSCSGKAVDPGYSTTSVPNEISVTMPYSKNGKPVVYNLNGYDSGSWDSLTTIYELPTRNVQGIQTKQLFVNESASNGRYPIEIVTPEFYGSYDKPYQSKLCDKKTVYINIIGGDTDDVNTHIIQ